MGRPPLAASDLQSRRIRLALKEEDWKAIDNAAAYFGLDVARVLRVIVEDFDYTRPSGQWYDWKEATRKRLERRSRSSTRGEPAK